MEYYPISFSFRGQRFNGYVHKHVDSYLVFFSDNTILKDFGGKVIFDISKKAIEHRKDVAADAAEFFKLVSAQLK
ncbi:MAG TPA: hypothetical protein VNS32_14185 [Flavisolibacter sp.]|nr:hypothetical protein [Flavisolibacter sp.]